MTEAAPDGAAERDARAELPFGRARIRFAGFAPKQVAHLLGGVEFVRGEPGLLRLAGAVADPRAACLYDADGARVPESLESWVGPEGARSPSLSAKLAGIEAEAGPARIALPARLPLVPGPVLFLGKLTGHFGHVLADMLSRAWALDAVPPDARLLFVPAKDPFAAPAARAVLELLGIDPARLVRIRRPTRFAELVCPLAAIRWSERIWSVFDRPHRAVGRRAAPLFPPPAGPVWLSRRGLGPGHRAIHGEDALEERLAREGVAIIRPETLPLAAQAALFRGDRPVAGVMGSAIHSLLFRDSPTAKAVAVLTDRDVHGRFLLFDAVKGAASHYLRCLDTPDVGPTRIQERTLHVDVPRAMALLDEAGLFGGARAAPALAPALLDVRGEAAAGAKAWAYLKDNPDRPGVEALRPGSPAHLRCPSGARWLGVVDERLADRIRLYAVRRIAAGQEAG